MYRYQVRKYILLSLWMVVLLWWSCHVLWFDLAQGIVDKFQDDYNKGYSTEYLNIPYSATYSKDPFWDAMMLYEWMSTQVKVSWVQYVEQALAMKNCSMDQKKEWAILYYFVPEFRSEIVRELKIGWTDFDSKIYSFDNEVILDYCTEFYNCITYKPIVEWSSESEAITSGTPENIRTNCKEFFQTNYREWQSGRKRIQNLEISWLWNDKYYNATLEDSPYDVMTDMGSEWEISYVDVQKPITPVFYKLPMFEDSEDALENRKNWGEEEIEFHGEVQLDSMLWLDDDWYEILEFNGQVELSPAVSLKQPLTDKSLSDKSLNDKSVGEKSVNEQALNNNSWLMPLSDTNNIVPYWRGKAYDLLVEGLGAFKFNEDESAYYWSLCEDSEIEVEANDNNVSVWGGNNTSSFWGYVSDATRAEYQELVDYMLEAVTSYADLPEDKAREIEAAVWNIDDYDWVGTAEEIEEAAQGILECYKSLCGDLMLDQKLACMLKCSCGEKKSPIFNPEINPGLWPLYMIRYCTVPAANPRYVSEWSNGTESFISTLGKKLWIKGKKRGWNSWWWSSWGSSSDDTFWSTFHVGWTNIKSLEEWVDEILWVIEELVGWWRLWVWTPERNYLDSSTQLMNFQDSTAYTIDWKERDISQEVWEPTEESVGRTMKSVDESWLVFYHVANPLNNPATKNYFRLVGNEGEGVKDLSSSFNSSMEVQSQWYLDIVPSFALDQTENSNASRYAGISRLFSKWFDDEWDFWNEKTSYLRELDEIVRMLLSKR